MHEDLTPMMRQYHAVKQETPDALLLFRLGDFYELFFEDAVTASRELEITLTARNKERDNPVPMCGVPYHAADGYIARLLRKGYKVAICDQVEAPQKGVKLVKREVTRVITPGTVTDTNVLSAGKNNFLLAINEADDQLGCAFLDISTGELRASQFSGVDGWNKLLLDIEHFSPSEVLFPEKLKDRAQDLEDIARTSMDDWLFDVDYASRVLREQLGTATLDGFGLNGKSAAVGASGAMIHYVRQTQKTTLEHITGLAYSESADYLVLDAATIRNLELLESSGGDSKDTLWPDQPDIDQHGFPPASELACPSIYRRKGNRISFRCGRGTHPLRNASGANANILRKYVRHRTTAGKNHHRNSKPARIYVVAQFYRASASDCKGSREFKGSSVRGSS